MAGSHGFLDFGDMSFQAPQIGYDRLKPQDQQATDRHPAAVLLCPSAQFQAAEAAGETPAADPRVRAPTAGDHWGCPGSAVPSRAPQFGPEERLSETSG